MQLYTATIPQSRLDALLEEGFEVDGVMHHIGPVVWIGRDRALLIDTKVNIRDGRVISGEIAKSSRIPMSLVPEWSKGSGTLQERIFEVFTIEPDSQSSRTKACVLVKSIEEDLLMSSTGCEALYYPSFARHVGDIHLMSRQEKYLMSVFDIEPDGSSYFRRIDGSAIALDEFLIVLSHSQFLLYRNWIFACSHGAIEMIPIERLVKFVESGNVQRQRLRTGTYGVYLTDMVALFLS